MVWRLQLRQLKKRLMQADICRLSWHLVRSKRLTSKHIREEFLHPLLVALLAFKLGGPVNAAFTTHRHEWRLASDNTRETPSLHTEGDAGHMFEDLRITVVWEMRDGEAADPSCYKTRHPLPQFSL
jgi:hypothetical protein